ncbi:MAG TPA: hypothetical protein VIP46_02770 [Pyrinomonadaceae bacterium]
MYADLEREAPRGGDDAPAREIVAVEEALAIIAPVDPDSVVHLGRGIYEARWVTDGSEAWEAASQLARMGPRIRVVAESPHRPEGLPRGLALEFEIAPLPFAEVAEIQ